MDEIKRLIAENHLGEALKKLNQLAKGSHFENEAIGLMGRLSSIENDVSTGIISFEHRNIEQNRISQAALTLAERLEQYSDDKKLGNSPLDYHLPTVETKAIVGPVKLFISFAEEDAAYKKEFLKHLTPIRRRGLVNIWDEIQTIGNEWKKEIIHGIEEADIILFMVSPSLMASEVMWDTEWQNALEKQKKGSARIVPVLIEPCVIEGLKIAHFQALPRNKKPISLWTNANQGWVEVVQELEKLIHKLRGTEK